MKKNILVFPCGSEVALEIHRSMRYSTHFDLIGASSVKDHGEFVFENYISGLPFYTEGGFIEQLAEIVKNNNIDAIYPAMDAVAKHLKENEAKLGCIVIGSDAKATAITASKSKTYELLKDVIKCPQWTNDIKKISSYPVFIKPDEGYGSRNVKLAKSEAEAKNHLNMTPNDYVFCEYLPGKEFTIDCFSNKDNKLLFAGARERARVSNGISVGTHLATQHQNYFQEVAGKINKILKPRGAWFFQMKESSDGTPTLLEVATRLGGSSSYFRVKGVNFAMLTVFDAFSYKVSVRSNQYDVELDRALSNRYKLNIEYKTVYVDFDDCLLIDDKLNTELVKFLYQSLNENKKLILITRHDGDIKKKLKNLRLSNVFDEVIHILDKEPKSKFMKQSSSSIFIDDSYAERLEVGSALNIPVFSPDMIEGLLY